MALRLIRIAPLAVAVALALPAVAAADVHIERGQTVGDVKVIGNDVRVDGTAHGWVTVIDGNLTIGRHGRIVNATVIGGRLVSEPGARVTGEVFEFGGRWPRLDSTHVLLLLGLLLALRVLLIWLVIVVAHLLAARPFVDALLASGRGRPLRTLVVGSLAGLGLGAASVLLALTVLGLIVALAIVGVLLVAATVGVALTLRALPHDKAPRTLAVALAVPLIGEGLAALAAVAGLGVLLRHATYTSDRAAAARPLS